MKKLCTALAFALAALAVTFAATAAAKPREARAFAARLTGTQEVPPVTTAARGWATFRLTRDGKALRYLLLAARIDNVTQAHIHCGRPGESGAVIAFLLPNPAAEARIAPPVAFVAGRVTSVIPRPEGTAPTGCPTGAVDDFADLLALVRSGRAYVNVHTTDHPAGEIRGQLRPFGRPFVRIESS